MMSDVGTDLEQEEVGQQVVGRLQAFGCEDAQRCRSDVDERAGGRRLGGTGGADAAFDPDAVLGEGRLECEAEGTGGVGHGQMFAKTIPGVDGPGNQESVLPGKPTVAQVRGLVGGDGGDVCLDLKEREGRFDCDDGGLAGAAPPATMTPTELSFQTKALTGAP